MENRINIACFKEGDETAKVDGIWQWDYGQILRIQGLNLPTAVEIHFSLDEQGGEALRRIGITNDGVTDVPIPDSMVENESAYGDSYYFFAYIYLSDEESGNTEYKIQAKVTTRSKPEGYNSVDSTFAAILKTVNEIAVEKIARPLMAKVGQVLSVKATDEEGKPTEFEATDPGGGASDEQIAEAVGTYMEAHPIEESDPTVPLWAKQPEKPTYTASDVGADAAGTAESKVSAHNTAVDAHNDIRLLVQGLTDRLNALADSDDETLDQMSEVVAYIKSNRSLIDAITTGKVSVSDIVDNLTTNASNKPLSAAQGVKLKALIDAITTVELDESLTDNTKAAPAGMVGELKGDISQISEEIVNLSGGAPTPVSVVSDMTDTTKIYLYTGQEDGYIAGNWYYYSGSAWISGGKYGETTTTEKEIAEPLDGDIPKVFFVGTAPTTKAEDELPLIMEYRSKTKTIKSYVTLKVQGDTSANYPKKNFNLKMFSDETRSEKMKCTFRDWSNTNKYCLKANWIDHTHARNVVGGRLWAQIVRSRADYKNYPIEYQESANCGAVNGFPVKVYLNGVYQGLYTWNIRKDGSMFNMDDSTGTHSALIADANNSVTIWRTLPSINGNDWTDELNDTVPDAVKTSFQNAYSFVINSTDEEFKENIENYFYLSSLIDYYIYIYCILMYGGLAKSQTMLTYDAQKFMANIYDMDTTWALYWNGSTFYDYETPCPSGYSAEKEIGQSNLLYERLVALFPEKIKERYEELRSDILSDANIINEFERFMDVISSDLYAEDYANTTANGEFTGIPSKTTNNLQKLREIIITRMAYCDSQIPMIAPIPATGITLDTTTITFTDFTQKTLIATVEPSDSTNTIVWSSSNENVATVVNGVITPIASGDTTITATAGIVSATCEVTVDVGEVVVYTITRNLTNCVSSSSETSINEGTAYIETFTANSGYTLIGAIVNVMMGEEDISSNYTDGVLTIPEVAGNIVITVSAVEEQALYPLVNGMYSNNTASVEVTNGNHVKITRFDVNAQIFANISNVNANISFESTQLSQDKWFSIKAGQTGVYTISNITNDNNAIVSTNFKKANTTTSGSFGIANKVGTDDGSKIATVSSDEDYGCLFVLVNGANNIENVVVEFDVSFVVDDVRYI